MKRILIGALAAMATGSCILLDGDAEVGMKRSFYEGGIVAVDTTGSDSADEDDAVTDYRVYVTGISYPEDYYWQRDTAYGSVESSLVVFQDGELSMELPVGADYFLSPDADMHRMQNGHLYSDYSTASETVICKDGVEIFRYSGRETIQGLVVRGLVVYTLGLSRSGEGLSYRKDGDLLFEHESGQPVGGYYESSTPTGALHDDDGKMCFCYKVGYSTSTGDVEYWWYSYRDGEDEQLTLSSDVTELYDLRWIEGTLCMASTKYDNTFGAPTLTIGEEDYTLGNSGKHSVSDCRIMYSDGYYYIKGNHTTSSTGITVDRLWWQDCSFVSPATDQTAYDFYVEGDDYAYVVVTSEGILSEVVHNGTSYTVDGRYKLSSPGCAALKNGKVHMALSPIDAYECPLLWVEGETQELPFNGYVTGLHFTGD